MWALFRKELTSFFVSPTAYLIIGLFLLLNGLFLWVFQGTYNIFDYGFADLSKFFLLCAWVFILLIPAISMKTFSEEIKLGTLELLYIKPPSVWQIVLAKYLGVVVLSLLALIPTLIYVLCVSELGLSIGNLDLGLAFGSYTGLIFLVLAYSGIGVFSSSLTDNPIVAFMVGLVLCFLFFYLPEAVSAGVEDGSLSLFLQRFGLKARFETMALGVLDTRDLVYFLSVSAFFLWLTYSQLKYRKR